MNSQTSGKKSISHFNVHWFNSPVIQLEMSPAVFGPATLTKSQEASQRPQDIPRFSWSHPQSLDGPSPEFQMGSTSPLVNAIFEADQHQTIKSSGNSRLIQWIFVETNIVKTSGRMKFTIDWKPFASCKAIHKNLLHASQLSSIEWQGTSCWQLSSRPEWGPPPPLPCFLRCSDQSSIDLNCDKR